VLRRAAVHLGDICTRGYTPGYIPIPPLGGAIHVLGYTPGANTWVSAVLWVAGGAAAPSRGVRSMVAFNYRRVPAIALARRLVDE
jgi:hypothetical protein